MQPLPYKAWAIACLLTIPNARSQDVFSSSGGQQGGQVVSSVTDFHNGNCDVKIKSLRTGYIHSFTIPCGTADSGYATAYSPPGKAVDISWGLNDGSRIPCATLFHELTHAWENYNRYDNGEILPVPRGKLAHLEIGRPAAHSVQRNSADEE